MAGDQSFSTNSKTLLEAFVIFRHGQRAPLFFAPLDPHKNHWPNGPGILTNQGKEDGYRIGRFLRQRYSDFLDERYHNDEIYIRSTDADRCLMTAQCCLAGLYPPKGEDVWRADMPWQPIPVHAVPAESDPLWIKMPKTFSPPTGGYLKEELNDAYKSITDNEHIIKQISKGTRAEGSIGNFAVLMDTLVLELNENLPGYLPPGLQLSREEAYSFAMKIYILMTMASKHIVSGAVFLLEDILEKAKAKIAGKAPKQKAFIYSLHDLNMSACLAALNINTRPSYGGLLLFELHKHPKTNEYFIKILYKKCCQDTSELENIAVNGSPLVSISDFEKLIQTFALSTKSLTD